MKFQFLCLFTTLLAGISLPAGAQQTPATLPDSSPSRQATAKTAPKGRGEVFERVTQVLDKLNLTSDQKEKIDQILDQAREDFRTNLRPHLSELEPKERAERVGEFLQGVRDQISQVLGEKQRAQWTEQMDALRDRRRGGDRAAGNPASTAPADRTRRAAKSDRGTDKYVDRLRDDFARLDLTQDQQAKINDLLKSFGQKVQSLREQSDGDTSAMRSKARALFANFQGQVREVLTAEQREKLRAIVKKQGAVRRGGDEEAKTEKNEKAKSAGSSSDNAPEITSLKTSGPQVGAIAPEFSLHSIDGTVVELSKFKGQVVVLEFGSYSSPEFRARAASMEKLKNELGARAQFFVIYTREAHAASDWEVDRNKDAGITVEQPRNADARKTIAIRARDSLKINVPILLDSVGNDTAIAYGAGPNTAIVIGRDGNIVARQQWFDAYGLRSAIEKASVPAEAQ